MESVSRGAVGATRAIKVNAREVGSVQVRAGSVAASVSVTLTTKCDLGQRVRRRGEALKRRNVDWSSATRKRALRADASLRCASAQRAGSPDARRRTAVAQHHHPPCPQPSGLDVNLQAPSELRQPARSARVAAISATAATPTRTCPSKLARRRLAARRPGAASSPSGPSRWNAGPSCHKPSDERAGLSLG